VRRTAAAAALAVAALAGGCRSIPLTYPDPAGPLNVACCAVEGPPVEVTYLGIMGWVVRKGATTLLSAPLFSDPSLLRTGLDTIAPDSARIDGMIARLGVDLSDVTVILSGHSHYDHLMDAPYVMERHAPRARLLLNETGAHQLAPWRLDDRLIVVDDSAGDASTVGRWIRVGDVRVMALRSAHAPQFAGQLLFHGERDRDLEDHPRLAYEWLDGRAHAYLVDFLENGRVVFRLYYQDAVSFEGMGFVPDSLLVGDGPEQRRVDLALIVATTHAEVPFHPEAILDNLRPRHIMLGHWEDLFRSPFEEPEPLFFNDFQHFLARLRYALPRISDEPVGWHIPVAGTRFLVR
jgi:L-ascorbate metabolism protein UlaG (beta-lactamase superfamily)